MSAILLRPVREQLEHDRVIRLLQARWKRRYQVGINPGSETNAAIGAGASTTYPDVVLTPPGARKPDIVIEVETGESVNRMEALFEWARLAQERAAFHLFVPSGSVEVARRLCDDNHIHVSEIWSFHHIGDQTRFTQVYRAPTSSKSRRASEPHRPARPAGKKATAAAVRTGTARKPQPKAKPAKSRAAKPADRTKATKVKKAAKGARPRRHA